MSGIEIRSTRQEKEWQTRTKICLDTKKLLFHFGKTISHSIARKMAMGGVCYAEIEEIFVKNNNKEASLICRLNNRFETLFAIFNI